MMAGHFKLRFYDIFTQPIEGSLPLAIICFCTAYLLYFGSKVNEPIGTFMRVRIYVINYERKYYRKEARAEEKPLCYIAFLFLDCDYGL
jgi:hypothetical protein